MGFKHIFVIDLLQGPPGRDVRILCWLFSRPRHHGRLVFLLVGDSIGSIQVVAESSKVPCWLELKCLKPESSLVVFGSLALNSNGSTEIVAKNAEIISKATELLHPDIRNAGASLLDSRNTDSLLSHRHLYLRNPLVIALNDYRSQSFSAIHEWFKLHRFVDISTPLITPSILYEPNSAIHTSNVKSNRSLFLSQCAGSYLEVASHAHERVYNLGPSFRNESRTSRHLMKYWHIKAELCSGEMHDIMDLVEIFLRDVFEAIREPTRMISALLGTVPPIIKIPFPRITYREALTLLNVKGHDITFGQNVSKPAEDLLTDHFGGPIWLTHKPRALEPFPYQLCATDQNLTMTADLISSGGFGEICGVAEESFTKEQLETRLKEKGKLEMQAVYGWVLKSRSFGMVPHTALVLGLSVF
ncbi:hypothetical protein EDB81DRAFT_878894 [Dactylonectria macrodidyma]|uniref:Aminoacyl-transfer RNA synthetases class-II family profile domain-containing protein n=1 Tax=Dactylonectria macrodidyma TaxID=307937 RepID=A0A9P9JNI1_9HYPO|nr:hypothetical protein EDB81DRAFT_878894 [Dactylonectria macrodidyma]